MFASSFPFLPNSLLFLPSILIHYFLRLYFVFVESAVPSNVPAQGCALRTIGQFIPRSFYTVSILLRCICPDHYNHYKVGRMQVQFQKVIAAVSVNLYQSWPYLSVLRRDLINSLARCFRTPPEKDP